MKKGFSCCWICLKKLRVCLVRLFRAVASIQSPKANQTGCRGRFCVVQFSQQGRRCCGRLCDRQVQENYPPPSVMEGNALFFFSFSVAPFSCVRPLRRRELLLCFAVGSSAVSFSNAGSSAASSSEASPLEPRRGHLMGWGGGGASLPRHGLLVEATHRLRVLWPPHQGFARPGSRATTALVGSQGRQATGAGFRCAHESLLWADRCRRRCPPPHMQAGREGKENIVGVTVRRGGRE